MKKRLVAALLLVALLLSMLAACGGQTNPDTPEAPETPNQGEQGNSAVGAYDGSEVTIKFAHTMGAKLRDVLDYHIAEFNKLYPNITIEHSSLGR